MSEQYGFMFGENEMTQLAFEGFEPEEEKQAPKQEKREPTKINLYWCYDASFGDKNIIESKMNQCE